ncbi:MAG TPA: hypothetical protein VIM11_14840 [Tepidisphaeraceae bacterium]
MADDELAGLLLPHCEQLRGYRSCFNERVQATLQLFRMTCRSAGVSAKPLQLLPA